MVCSRIWLMRSHRAPETLRFRRTGMRGEVATSVAVYRVAQAHGISPSFAAGHSLGEYSAHVAAGTLSFADALRTVRRRGRYMQEAVPLGEGAMAAVLGLDRDAVAAACAE